ncbi:MAG: protein kinase [Anaerolineae bacterium]|nr:protein kinase [Anaerolineae bacterium]
MDDMIGRQLGNYKIVGELGRGGMAVVYRAFQPSLNRYVAIKVLPPHLGLDQEFVERFQREALASAKLRHPNIVVIHDVGHQQGIYYIVMELLEGRTLKQMIEGEGALSIERANRIVEQVAAALDYAHQQGFVHRDVKPANIFVGKDDHTTLTDFGIAKAASEAQQLTRTGILMGTPEYMSPEQAEGEGVDYRTDLYALGIVLYQMLVGQVPFRGTTPHAILHAVIYDPPAPLRQLRQDLAPAIEAVVLKAIDKRPERRYQSGVELTEALAKASTSRAQPLVIPPQRVPPPAVGPASGEDAGERKRPILWIVVAMAAILCGLLAVFIFMILGGDEPGETPIPPTTAVASITQTATPDSGAVALTETAAAAATQAASTVPTGTPKAATDTPTPTVTQTLTATPEPPTDTPTPTATDTPTATPTPCAFAPQGLFAGLWQTYRDDLGCPLYKDPKLIQDAEQPFDNGHMFWRQDNDHAYVVYEKGAKSGDYQAFTGMWSAGDPEYSCSASPPPGKVQPKRGFGAVWCDLGGSSAVIGWGLSEEAGFGPGYGDPLVHQFQRGFIFRDSDGTTKGLAYIFFRPSKTFVRVSY